MSEESPLKKFKNNYWAGVTVAFVLGFFVAGPIFYIIGSKVVEQAVQQETTIKQGE